MRKRRSMGRRRSRSLFSRTARRVRRRNHIRVIRGGIRT